MATSSLVRSRIQALHREYASLRPGKESLLAMIDEVEIPESVYNSNAIENSSLTLEETEKILLEQMLSRNVSVPEVFEAVNLARVIEYQRNRADDADLSKERILLLHQMLIGAIDDDIAGRFRQRGEYVRVGAHIAPAPEQVEGMIDEILLQYASDLDSYFLDRIARFHLDFEVIHPFCDGNGRVGRVIINAQLLKLGLPPPIIRNSEKQTYYRAFREYADRKRTATMERILALALIESLHKRRSYLQGQRSPTTRSSSSSAAKCRPHDCVRSAAPVARRRHRRGGARGSPRETAMSNWISRVATDVGGTFTDLVRLDIDPESGQSRVTTAKTATTPPDFERGVLDVLRKGGGVPLREIDFLAHGTTVVINALTERKGAKVGLITTEGFRDTLEIARGNRPDLFNLHYRKPKPFVARYLRRELPGRMNYRGAEMRPLDLAPLAAIVEDFRSDGVEAVAICFLHSYANPAHERAAEAEVRRLWPEVHAVSSHRIAREWREYERTSTAVLSAYVQPTAERYLRRLSDGLASRGFAGSPYVMQSNGGIDSLQAAARTPITMIESGPSSGVWAAAQLGAPIGDGNIIALDIGGTTAKCSLIDRGNIRIVTDYWVGRDGRSAGYPVMVPVVDMVEIGNGGGSIASDFLTWCAAVLPESQNSAVFEPLLG